MYRVLRKLFEPKRMEVTGEWRNLQSWMLHDLYYLPKIIQVVKLGRMRWAYHVACMEEKRSAFTFLVGKPEGKKPLGRHSLNVQC